MKRKLLLLNSPQFRRISCFKSETRLMGGCLTRLRKKEVKTSAQWEEEIRIIYSVCVIPSSRVFFAVLCFNASLEYLSKHRVVWSIWESKADLSKVVVHFSCCECHSNGTCTQILSRTGCQLCFYSFYCDSVSMTLNCVITNRS